MNTPRATRCKKCGSVEITAVCRWCGTWKLSLAAALLFLASCTTIDAHRAPPADWPKLKVVEHRVGAVEMLKRCYRYVSLPMKLAGSVPFACAEVDFVRRRCDIWAIEDAEEGVMEHERDHCDGRDHVGDDTLAQALRAYRAAGGI